MGTSSGLKLYPRSAEELISSLAGDSDRDVRVYRDMNGIVSFATMDDVCIEPNDDARVGMLSSIASKLDDDELDKLEGYEGSLNQLTSDTLKKVLGKL